MTGADRVVVIAPNWLGDAVMALPAIADIRRHYAGCAPDDCGAAAGGAVVLDGERRRRRNDVAGRRRMRAGSDGRKMRGRCGQGLDIAILLPNSFATAWIAKNATIPERWGFATDFRGRMLTRAMPKPKGTTHQSEYYQALTTALGIAAGPPFAEVRPDVDHVRELALDLGLDLDEPFVVFAPGAAYGRAKQWLPERFAQLADLIINDRGWTVIMVGSNADRSTCADIAARLPATGTRMNRLIDLSRQDRSPDAGRRDVARTRGGVERFGRDAPGRRRRREGRGDLRRHERATHRRRCAHARRRRSRRIMTHEVFCRPCMLRECPIDHRCMSGISARTVLRLALEACGLGLAAWGLNET